MAWMPAQASKTGRETAILMARETTTQTSSGGLLLVRRRTSLSLASGEKRQPLVRLSRGSVWRRARRRLGRYCVVRRDG